MGTRPMWARAMRGPNRDRIRPGDGQGPWHWIFSTEGGTIITACGLFGEVDELVIRDGNYANFRCQRCNHMREYFLTHRGSFAKSPGWERIPAFGQGLPPEHMTGSAQSRRAARQQRKMEKVDIPTGIQHVIPALSKRRMSNSATFPVLVEYHEELGGFVALSPVAVEYVVVADSLGEALALIGEALEVAFAGE